MKNKGFTLIELLAVIVILAIIALIATPIILGIIKDANKNAFKESINGIINGIKLNATMQVIDDEIEYKYENNKWEDKEIEIDGSIPKFIQVKVNKEGKVKYAINNGEYCATKEYDSGVIIKTIGSEIKEDYCRLGAMEPTDESCFRTRKYNNGTVEIEVYYNYQDNKPSNKVCPKDVVIPEEIDNNKVTKIRGYAFQGKELTSVIIPESVTSIGSASFSVNKLRSVVIPESVTSIGDAAFASNQLTSVTIPDSVISIGYGAFRNNKLPYEQAFIYNRNSDGSINYNSLNSYGGLKRDNVIISDSVTSIGSSAFSFCDLTSVTIPNSVRSIGSSAFSYNDLTSVTIPDSVTSIGDYAFYINKLTSVIIKGKTSISDFISFGNEVFSWDNATSCTGNDTKCITFQSE